MVAAKFPSTDHIAEIIEAVLLDTVREMEHVEVWSSEQMGTKNKRWSAHLSQKLCPWAKLAVKVGKACLCRWNCNNISFS